MASLDLEIGGGGGGGGGLKEIVFRPFEPHFGLKIGGRAPRAPLLEPPLCGHVTGRPCAEYSV